MQLLNLTPLNGLFDPHVPALTSTASTSRFATATRSHLGGELRSSHVGGKVRLGGWVHRTRDLGGIVFLDLRDRAGLVQVSFDPKSTSPQVIERAGKLGLETVVMIDGEVAARPAEMRNPDMETGEIEVRARDFQIVGPADTPAIPVARGKGEKLPAEELRLKHRNLDLRRAELQKNLILRHRLQQATRRFLDERCFRDEDLRADRQPEFTQIDIEASFVEREDIIGLTEGLLATLFGESGVEI